MDIREPQSEKKMPETKSFVNALKGTELLLSQEASKNFQDEDFKEREKIIEGLQQKAKHDGVWDKITGEKIDVVRHSMI